jgi:RNA-directed DNA polymerase
VTEVPTCGTRSPTSASPPSVYAVSANGRALSAFRHYVANFWPRTLRWRSQKDGFTWDRMPKLADGWLPAPRILHPWPDQRFAVKHPR